MYMQCGLASCYNTQMVWFQKIHTPTPKMVIGSQKPNFLKESMKQTGNSRGGGGGMGRYEQENHP